MMQAAAVNNSPNKMVTCLSSNMSNTSSTMNICAATPDTSITQAENLKPMPVSVVMPSTKPTQAQAAPMPSAALAPISKPCTKACGPTARPVMFLPRGPSKRGIQEQATVSVMPQKAARKGVNCINSRVTMTTSGMNKCHELLITHIKEGMSDGFMPCNFRRLASRCTMNKMAK